jgi:hypothetical protein
MTTLQANAAAALLETYPQPDSLTERIESTFAHPERSSNSGPRGCCHAAGRSVSNGEAMRTGRMPGSTSCVPGLTCGEDAAHGTAASPRQWKEIACDTPRTSVAYLLLT